MTARRFITVCLALLTIAFASGGASAQLLTKKTLSLAAAKKMAVPAENSLPTKIGVGAATKSDQLR